jgi:hypothetical protein
MKVMEVIAFKEERHEHPQGGPVLYRAPLLIPL